MLISVKYAPICRYVCCIYKKWLRLVACPTCPASRRLASCCFCWWFQFLLVLLHVSPVICRCCCCCCCRCVAADNWWMSVFGARFDWRFRSFVAPIASHTATWINYVAQTDKSCLHFLSWFVLFWAPLAAALKLQQPCPKLCCSNTHTHKHIHKATEPWLQWQLQRPAQQLATNT